MSETLTLSRDQGEQVHNAFSETVEKHIDAHDILERLHYDPDLYTFQSFDTVQLSAEPISPESLESLAGVANPRLYKAVREGLCTRQAVSVMRKVRKNGRNLIIYTNHQSVTDMPVVATGMTLDEYTIDQDDPNIGDKRKWGDYITNNGVIVGRAMTTLQAVGVPAVEVVRQGGEVFLSTPRTRTINTLVSSMPELLLPTLINNSNGAMRRACKLWLEQSTSDNQRRLYVAGGGRTDVIKGDPAQPERISMGKAHPAVCSITSNATVLPTLSWDRGPTKDPIFILGPPTSIENASDIESVEAWQRRTLAGALGISLDSITVEA